MNDASDRWDDRFYCINDNKIIIVDKIKNFYY